MTRSRSRLRPPPTSRREGRSKLRRATQVVLVLGTALAVAAAFGSLWVARAGVVVAVVAGVLACSLAWRELFWARRQHAKAMLTASREHGALLGAERSRNAEVVDNLSERVHSAGMVIAGQRGTIAQLRTEVSGLNGDVFALQKDNTYLVGEVQQREGVISALRDTVRAREAELVALQDDLDAEDAGQVHHMPRRMLTEDDLVWSELPAAGELWSDGSHPTVVDLQTIEAAMVLPNYENDRQVG